MFVFTLFFVSLFSLVAGYFMYTQLGRSETVTMPALVGLPQDEAVDQISRARLNLGDMKTVENNTHEPGTVFYQSPQAGKTVKRGRDVFIRVAKEGVTTTVPVLRGLDEKSVPLELGKNNLSADTLVARSYNSNLPEGQVIDTFPPGGAEVPEHTAVALLVSRGSRPRDYSMPDLISLREREARETLEPLEASINVERELVPQRSLHGIVIGQNPKPGARVSTRSIVNLKVGRAVN